MTLLAFLLIVTSASLHASWNLLAKKSHMTMAFYGLICITSSACWAHVQLWTPINVPGLPVQFWINLVASILSDFCYCFGLMMTYRYLEMSSAYPIMRSLPIIITAATTGLLGLGKPLSPMAYAGMAVVFVGCLLMPLRQLKDIKLSSYFNKYMLFVILTACGTTGYTVFDSESLKILKNHLPEINTAVRSMTFYSTRGIMLSSCMLLYILVAPAERARAKDFIVRRDWHPFVAGICATGTYILVLMAMNYVTNVSYVQVFRQLGLPLGMGLGIVFLKEKPAPIRFVGVSLICLGLALTVIRF